MNTFKTMTIISAPGSVVIGSFSGGSITVNNSKTENAASHLARFTTGGVVIGSFSGGSITVSVSEPEKRARKTTL